MEPADHDDAEDGNEDEEGDISAALEKWRGAADPDQRPDVADPAEMRGYIDRHGDVKRHHRNIQRGAITAETDPDRGRDRNLSETAGNLARD